MHAVRASLRLLSILFCRCWSFAFFHCLPVLRNPFHDFSLQFRDNAVSLHHPLPSALPSSPSSPLAARLDCHLTSLTPFFRFHIAWYRFHLSLSLHTIIIASPRTHTYSIFPSSPGTVHFRSPHVGRTFRFWQPPAPLSFLVHRPELRTPIHFFVARFTIRIDYNTLSLLKGPGRLLHYSIMSLQSTLSMFFFSPFGEAKNLGVI